ncbi:MAG: hypothetical protein K2X93_10775 [Candidatus Obscuribacterales bacterium]|nr:hypothetical protein [Candidatus Obscuribacterales bacterium]
MSEDDEKASKESVREDGDKASRESVPEDDANASKDSQPYASQAEHGRGNSD